MIRVLLVDDHPVVRAGFAHLLEQAGDIAVVDQADNTQQGYAAWMKSHPDVVVCDLSMPGPGGLELLRKIMLRESGARILVFSMMDSPLLMARAFEMGAMGFVSKNAAPESLVKAVRAVYAGNRYLSENLPQQLLSGKTDDSSNPAKLLSAREFEIFRLLASGHSPQECANMLNLSLKTVGNHQTLIKEKLGVSTLAALVHLALKSGVISANETGL
jgi:DNA-binding NarL/FixJ family response regulator